LISPELVRLAEEGNGMTGVLTKLQDQHYNLSAAVLSREGKNISKLMTKIAKLHQSLYSVRSLSLLSRF